MEFTSAIPKGGQVAISVRDEDVHGKPVNPQSFLYFYVLYMMTVFFSVPLAVAPSIIRHAKQSPFKVHGGFFVIMTIVTVSLAILASAILIFTSHYLQSYMRNIHYSILKSIGCLSGILAPFSLFAVLFVPHNLNWIAYSVICLILIVILVLYYFLWKSALIHQQNKNCDEFPIHWTGFFFSLVPLSIVLHSFIPKGLHWLGILLIGVQVAAVLSVSFTFYMRFYKEKQTSMQGTSSVTSDPARQQDKTINHL